MDVINDNIGNLPQTLVKEAPVTSKNYAFWLGIALCTIYQSYRYPLQYSSAGTSPTYSDTPVLWQAGKFVLAVPLIVVSAMRWLGNSARIANWPIFVGTLFLSSFSLLKIVNGHDAQYLDAAFWLFFSLLLALSVDSVNATSIDKYFYILLAYAFGSTVVQVFLFLAFGRLPALAFEGSYLVRFGGFLDDPNGFAAILFLLLGWSYKRFKGRKRVLILAGLVISLLLTQSWTALVFFMALLLVCILIIAKKRPLAALATICALPLGAMLVLHWVPQLQEGLLLDIFQDKQESIQGHLFPWTLWVSKWTDWTVLGVWNYSPYESWWASSMVNFGILWFAAYLVLVITLLIYSVRANRTATPECRPVYAGLLLFGCYFAVGSLNLPFPIIFPINALFFLLLFLVAFRKIVADDRPMAFTKVSGE
jgi:hypothetical protein